MRYHGGRGVCYISGMDSAWPSLTYCEYCGRQHPDGGTNCDGCGAPKLQWRAARYEPDHERDVIDVTHLRSPGGRRERIYVKGVSWPSAPPNMVIR